MKTRNIILMMAFITLAIASCKKENPASTTNTGGGTPPPSSNYYVFDSVTYTGLLGWGQGGNQYNFFCTTNGGDPDLRLNFKGTTPADQPVARTYSVIATGFISDSTTCSITLKNSGSTYKSTGGGVITVGKSGTKTTYQFTDIPMSGNKKVSGNFIY